MRFAARYPTHVDRRGMPLTWRAFHVGLQVIEREDARAALRMASATNTGSMDEKDRREWLRDQTLAAGW